MRLTANAAVVQASTTWLPQVAVRQAVLEKAITSALGTTRLVLLEPIHTLTPCPRDAERLTLAQRATRAQQLREVNPTTLNAAYRGVLGVNPRKGRGSQRCTYTSHEQGLLGLLPPPHYVRSLARRS